MNETCKICTDQTEVFGEATLLGRQVSYYRCVGCGFIQTEDPYWLAEAYSSPIHPTDIGHVERNQRLAAISRSVITTGFNSDGRFLDYGGGYGLLVRMMRDRGYDFYRDDPYCDNLFAGGFDRVGDDGYELVTAFEVAEHLPDPMTGFGSMLERSDSVLFSTLLVPDPPPALDSWWYYSLQSGQHVSLYTAESVRRLSETLGLRSAVGKDLHLLTNSRRALRLFPAVSRRKVAVCLNVVVPSRKSLIESDYEALTNPGGSLR